MEVPSDSCHCYHEVKAAFPKDDTMASIQQNEVMVFLQDEVKPTVPEDEVRTFLQEEVKVAVAQDEVKAVVHQMISMMLLYEMMSRLLF